MKTHNLKFIVVSAILSALITSPFLIPAPVRADQTGFLLPTADGSQDSSGWENKAGTACSGADCSSEVNEGSGNQCNSESDGNGSYIQSNTLDARQTFLIDLSSIPDGSSVTGVNVTACNERTQTNASFQTVTCVGGVCQDFGTDILPTTGYDLNAQLHNVNFTKNSGSVLEIGVKNTNNRTLRISKIRANVTYALPQTPPPPVVVGGGTTYVYQPPVISDIKTSAENGVYVVEFNTKEPSTAQITYSETQQMNYLVKSLNQNDATTAHRFILSDALTDRVYYFKVSAINQHGVSAESSVQVLDAIPPTLLDVHIASIASTSVEVQWQTDEIASSTVRWGRTTALNNVATGDGGTMSHDVIITGLNPKTLYFFRAESVDSFGNLKVGNVRGFLTLSSDSTQGIPAPSDAGATQQGNESTITWKNPTDPDFAFVMITKNTHQPKDYSDGELVYNGTGQSLKDPLAIGMYYALWAVDRDGNFSDMVFVEPSAGGSSAPLFDGQENETVKKVQEILKTRGFFPSNIAASGFFGPATARAVKKFQQSIGANPDGILTGVEQAILLGNSELIPAYGFLKERKRGETGDDIVQLQQFLADFGYFPFDGTPTGYFGPLTERSLIAFQKSRHISATGRLNQETITTIMNLHF